MKSTRSALVRSFIGGRFVDSAFGESHELLDPSNGEVIGNLDLAGATEVEAAVAAASSAFPEWSGATPGARSSALIELANGLTRKARELASTESRDAGKPIKLTKEVDGAGSVDNGGA